MLSFSFVCRYLEPGGKDVKVKFISEKLLVAFDFLVIQALVPSIVEFQHLLEHWKPICTGPGSSFNWTWIEDLPTKFLRHHRNNREALKRSWIEFITCSANQDIVRKPSRRLAQKRHAEDDGEIAADGADPVIDGSSKMEFNFTEDEV